MKILILCLLAITSGFALPPRTSNGLPALPPGVSQIEYLERQPRPLIREEQIVRNIALPPGVSQIEYLERQPRPLIREEQIVRNIGQRSPTVITDENKPLTGLGNVANTVVQLLEKPLQDKILGMVTSFGKSPNHIQTFTSSNSPNKVNTLADIDPDLLEDVARRFPELDRDQIRSMLEKMVRVQSMMHSGDFPTAVLNNLGSQFGLSESPKGPLGPIRIQPPDTRHPQPLPQGSRSASLNFIDGKPGRWQSSEWPDPSQVPAGIVQSVLQVIASKRPDLTPDQVRQLAREIGFSVPEERHLVPGSRFGVYIPRNE